MKDWYREECDKMRDALRLLAQNNGTAREDARNIMRESFGREVTHLRRRLTQAATPNRASRTVTDPRETKT